MARHSKVTITDIAQHVGMTTMTASRALNRPEKEAISRNAKKQNYI